MSDRAVQMAREVGAVEALGTILTDRSALLMNAGYVREALACAQESAAMLERTSRRWSLVWAKSWILNSVRYMCRPREALALAEAALPEAEAVGQVGAKMLCSIARTFAQTAFTGRLDALDAASAEMERDYGDFGTWRELGVIFKAWGAMDRGEADAAAILEGSSERMAFDAWRDIWWSIHFALATFEDTTKAQGILDLNRDRIPVAGAYAAVGARIAAYFVVDGLIRLGEDAAAAALYPLCTETLATGLVGEISLLGVAAGRAAEAGGDLEAAERHFTEALHIADEGGNLYAQADVRLAHGRMLLTRALDAERGRVMLEEALTMFEAAGRTRWARECRELLGR